MSLGDVLSLIRPGEAWTLSGDDVSGLEWLEDTAPPSEAEIAAGWGLLAWQQVRAQRDRLLARSDWTQVADAPVDAAAWAAYRQALRDVPQDFATPGEVVWPTPPA